MAASNALEEQLVTAEFVLIELADAFARPVDRPSSLSLLALLQSDPKVEVVAAGPVLWPQDSSFRNCPDKDWPLTDCLSLVVMNERGITDALTGDEHFRQAGYRKLL